MTKRCSKCKIKLSLDNFGTDKSKKDGKFIWCKSCRKLHSEKTKNLIKQYWNKNRKYFSEQKKIYYQNNKSKIKKRAKLWYKNNKQAASEHNKKYYALNKDRIKLKNKEWAHSIKGAILTKKSKEKYAKNNRNKIRESRLKNKLKRLSADPIFKFKEYFSNVFRSYLKKNNLKKQGQNSFSILGYSLEELKIHIQNQFEPWMNWNNQGTYRQNEWDDNNPLTWKWQLDHIIPHSQFSYSSFEDPDFKKCWSLNNLRPLSAKQNILDKNRRQHNYGV